METALSYLTILPLDKEQQKVFVQKAIDEILSGYENPLKIEGVLKGIEETIKAIRADVRIREAVFTELEKHGTTAKVYGCEFTKSNRKTWGYDVCNDSVLAELEAKAGEIAEKIKDRRRFLQTLPEGGVVNPDTGEVILPASFTTTEVLTVKIK